MDVTSETVVIIHSSYVGLLDLKIAFFHLLLIE